MFPSGIDLIVVGGEDFDFTDVLCISEDLRAALNKPTAVFGFREINPDSTFYDAIMEEGVQSA